MDDMFAQMDQVTEAAATKSATGRSRRTDRGKGVADNAVKKQEEEKLDFNSILQESTTKKNPNPAEESKVNAMLTSGRRGGRSRRPPADVSMGGEDDTPSFDSLLKEMPKETNETSLLST